MTTTLAIEPVAPMSAVNVEVDILDTIGDKILIQHWNGEYLQLTPSTTKNDRTIYRVEGQSRNIQDLSLPWFQN